MADGFRIGRISVEGFKGFTKAQEIDLSNRHVFLIGPNGNGKSSIIEAIRWGLFGSTGRPNDIVRNAGYEGDCRVEIGLARDGKEWHLRRILTPGGGGGSSRAELFDEGGKEHPMRDVLPQMDSLNAGEGTHIIFAPQSAPLRRQPEDLTPFERTVFGHLGLTHARVMLSHLDTFVHEQEDEETSLDGLVSDAYKEVNSRIAELERQRGLILSSPPWDGDLQPSIADTESKAKELIGKIETSESGKDFGQFSLGALVGEAERALEERVGLDQTPLSEELEQLDAKLVRLEGIQSAWENILRKREDLRKADEHRQKILDGVSLDELQERVERRRQAAETLDLRRRLGETAGELLDRTEGEDLLPCPICETGRKRDEFNRLILAMVHAEGEKDSSGLHVTENQLNEAKQIEGLIQALNHEVEECKSDLDTTVAAEDDVELTEAVRGGRVADHIKAMKKHKTSVVAQIDGFEDWHGGVQVELKNLREEARYQELQLDLSNLRAVNADMERVRRAFERFVQFGESVRDIRDSVKSTLIDELRRKVPSVAEELTSVFRALTRHPHFDRLVIDEEKLPGLVLTVASSSDSFGTPRPPGVLNGQAQSALELVPYFALGQADEAPTEVYLVLLDDPTRAFDREHIGILIERLADLGKRVQLVVATQEMEAFRDLLPRSFERESYVVVEPKNWSYADGPELVTEYD